MKIRSIVVVILILFFTSILSSDPINLSGLVLTHNDLISFKNNSFAVSHSLLIERIKKSNTALYKYIQSNCMWHLQTPMTGMIADRNCSYIPYRFSLWELAPKKGEGISVVLLDTGVAAFEGNTITKHPDLVPIGFNQFENYNCCFKGLQDFIKYIGSFLKPDSVPQESEIVGAIIDYCATKKTDGWCRFLKKYGRREFFDSYGNLTKAGNKVLCELTNGRKGILPHGSSRFFSFVELSYPRNYATLYELLPIPSGSLIDKNNYCLASHGTHIYGIINSQGDIVCGLAPNARTIMLKVSDGGGASDAQTILEALKKAQSFNGDIVNISLKIEQIVHNDLCEKIEQELQKFKYVVAASGNEFSSYKKPTISFPACLDSVRFTVGAYNHDGKDYGICPFCQYEKGQGPAFVAPGFNILSTAIPKDAGEYLFLSGTSMATAMITGFVALMLGEFKDIFTQDQLLKVCYHSSKKLGKTTDWDEKCLYGAIDMRTALFILHVCKHLKEKSCFIEKKFEAYLRASLFILEQIETHCAEYSLPYNLAGMINFVVDFIVKAYKATHDDPKLKN